METAQTRELDWQELCQFTDRQREAIEATYTHRYILYGGARGGGKSRLLRWWLLEFLIDAFVEMQLRNVHVMLACETYRDLVDRQITKIGIEFPQWLGTVKETKKDGLGFHLNDELGGGVICLRNLDDASKYQSAEFAAIGIDELTKIDKGTFDILRGSLRWTGIEHTVFMGATNPGGPGHGWVKQLWVDRDFPKELRPMADKFIFIKSLPSDNPHLAQSYWEELNSLPDDLRRAWVEGDWSVFAGQAFSAFRHDRHVIDPFEIPSHWVRYRGVDWGYTNPFCCLWGAKDPDTGRMIIYKEAYNTGLTDRQQARLINEMTLPEERILQTYADPSMWATKNAQDVVTSTADEYSREGVYLTQADNNRLSGKRKIDRMLLDLPDGKPGIQFFPQCKNLIRTLPMLPYDDKNVEDIDTDAEDHCLVGDTLIATIKGDVKLSDVLTGDLVLTRYGYKPVLKSWKTKTNAEVYKVYFDDGTELVGTGNHPVYVVGKGFISIDALRYGDIIIRKENVTEALCQQKQLYSRGSSLEDTLMEKTLQTKGIMHLVETIASRVLSFCTKRFGLTRTGKYQRDTISTTKTETLSTMTFLILSAFQPMSIYPSIQSVICQGRSIWKEYDILRLNGIDRARGAHGILNTERKYGKQENPLILSVTSAERLTNHSSKRRLETSVLEIASQHKEEKIKKILLNKFVLFAELHSLIINITINKLALENAVGVLGVEKQNNLSDVYNLTIMGKHEFFANGVLTHNCYDSLRYLLTSLREAQRKPIPQKPPLRGLGAL